MRQYQGCIRVNDVLFSPFGVAGGRHFIQMVLVREGTVFGLTAFRYPSAMGDVNSMATSRAALSAPVWPPDMIFWSIMGENTGCSEKIQGLIWYLKIFIFWAHIIRFSWKLADEERSRGENQKKSNFLETQQVKAARCNLLFF